jgi:hypothetical protein
MRSEPPPAVARLFTSAETNSPVSDARVRAHESSSLGAEKSNRRSRQCRASLGPPQKIEKVNFQNQCSSIEAPRTWPG